MLIHKIHTSLNLHTNSQYEGIYQLNQALSYNGSIFRLNDSYIIVGCREFKNLRDHLPHWLFRGKIVSRNISRNIHILCLCLMKMVEITIDWGNYKRNIQLNF